MLHVLEPVTMIPGLACCPTARAQGQWIGPWLMARPSVLTHWSTHYDSACYLLSSELLLAALLFPVVRESTAEGGVVEGNELRFLV